VNALTTAGVNWGDIGSLSLAGVNWGDIGVLSGVRSELG